MCLVHVQIRLFRSVCEYNCVDERYHHQIELGFIFRGRGTEKDSWGCMWFSSVTRSKFIQREYVLPGESPQGVVAINKCTILFFCTVYICIYRWIRNKIDPLRKNVDSVSSFHQFFTFFFTPRRSIRYWYPGTEKIQSMGRNSPLCKKKIEVFIF